MNTEYIDLRNRAEELFVENAELRTALEAAIERRDWLQCELNKAIDAGLTVQRERDELHDKLADAEVAQVNLEHELNKVQWLASERTVERDEALNDLCGAWARESDLEVQRDEARRLFREAMEWGDSAELIKSGCSWFGTEPPFGVVRAVSLNYTKPRPVATWEAE